MNDVDAVFGRRAVISTVIIGAIAASAPHMAVAQSAGPERITVANRGKAMIMANGETILDLDKYAVYIVDLDSVNPEEVILTAQTKRVTLAEWLKESETNGLKLESIFANTVSISGSPFFFDGLSDEAAYKLVGNPVVVESHGTAYWCAILAYGCHMY